MSIFTEKNSKFFLSKNDDFSKILAVIYYSSRENIKARNQLIAECANSFGLALQYLMGIKKTLNVSRGLQILKSIKPQNNTEKLVKNHFLGIFVAVKYHYRSLKLGNNISAYFIAHHYKNIFLHKKYLLLAAINNVPLAAADLAIITKNPFKAFRLAMIADCPRGWAILADYFGCGIGCQKNIPMFLELCEKAIRGGCLNAYRSLGIYYRKDPIKSAMYFKLSGSNYFNGNYDLVQSDDFYYKEAMIKSAAQHYAKADFEKSFACLHAINAASRELFQGIKWRPEYHKYSDIDALTPLLINKFRHFSKYGKYFNKGIIMIILGFL